MKHKEIITVLEDLLKSHEELLAGVGNIVCDIGLLNTCRINGDKAIAFLKEDDSEERLALLDALEAGGVDNWDGYDFAMEDAGI